MKQFHFLVYGKDERQRCLKEILENRGHVAKNAEEASVGFFDAVLLPLPETETFFGKIKEELVPGQIVFGANFGQSVTGTAKEKKITVVDYMKADGVAEKNAVSVAEGILAEAICAMKENLCGSRCLVCGFGRCGSRIAERLAACQADVDVFEKEDQKRQAVEAAGATWRPHADPGAYELIVNTVPQPLFTGQVLSRCKREVCILDLASGNGGVDLESCKAYGICAKRCPGLPARYAPKAAAKILADVIEKEMDVRKKGE